MIIIKMFVMAINKNIARGIFGKNCSEHYRVDKVTCKCHSQQCLLSKLEGRKIMAVGCELFKESFVQGHLLSEVKQLEFFYQLNQ
jgi:hypothetical protein